jgi:PA domain-containing protein/LVIVD repeat-containing protein
MRTTVRLVVLSLAAAAALMLPVAATASVADAVSTFTYSKNMHPQGYSAREVPFTGAGSGIFNSDLAFWGKMAVQGTYEGFRLIDISDPENPTELVNFTDCVRGTTTGNQGDVIVWGNILVRSWNSPTPAGGRFCGGVFTPAGQEGVHIFDISNPASPVGLAFVATPCGSHTATGVPDLANGRLLVYNSSSSGSPGCRGIDILQVPLAAPATASYLRFEASGEPSPTVTVNPPSSAAGTYPAAGADFGPAPPVAGISGPFALVNDGIAPTSDGCTPFTLPAGAIAIIDRGNCEFQQKTQNAQDAGASAVVIVNNVPGPASQMGGTNAAIVIPAVQVSQADGATIKTGLPATGSVQSSAVPDRSCHDTGVILGDVMRVACAGGNGVSSWTVDPAEGGSLTDPKLLYSRSFAGVTIGHTAAFTWDGEVLIFGHEPGGGGQARCQATSPEVDRTLFFLNAETGATVGTFVQPRPQGPTENCTWHNLNVVPTDKGYVLVSGNYQMGISVVEFTNPANAKEIAFADPAPLVHPTNPNGIVLGGDWSTYWYDGRIYESDITRGLIIWNLSDNAVAGAKKLGHLNPQTLETSFPLKGTGK